MMKAAKIILVALCILTLILPVTVHASEYTSDYFTVDLRVGEQNGIAPGDIFTESFNIENIYKKPLAVRVCAIENVNESPIYSALEAGWLSENNEVFWSTLDKLPGDWYLVKPGDIYKLNLIFRLPDSCDNVYQGKMLNARFTFEARTLDDGEDLEDLPDLPDNPTAPTPPPGPSDPNAPNTGDETNLPMWTSLFILALSTLVALILTRKKNC